MAGTMHPPICTHCGIHLHDFEGLGIVIRCMYCQHLYDGVDIGLINARRLRDDLDMIEPIKKNAPMA